ncbi:LysR family transcriptional regulator [Kingella oralis]
MNDWDDLHCFTVLVEKQTLTAAAETLGVQHSTISRRIARLEATLGLRLFDRIGRRCSPTKAHASTRRRRKSPWAWTACCAPRASSAKKWPKLSSPRRRWSPKGC